MKKIIAGLLIAVCFLAIFLLSNTSGDGKKSITAEIDNPTSPAIKEVEPQSDIVTTKFGFEIK